MKSSPRFLLVAAILGLAGAPSVGVADYTPRIPLASDSSQARIGTSNIGITAVDARWSNYGVYLLRMIETVQIEWDRDLACSKIYLNSGSVVSVKFVMDSKGAIRRIVNVEPSAGTSDAAARACVSALIGRSPYGGWSENMVAVLGKEQTMTYAFYYQ